MSLSPAAGIVLRSRRHRLQFLPWRFDIEAGTNHEVAVEKSALYMRLLMFTAREKFSPHTGRPFKKMRKENKRKDGCRGGCSLFVRAEIEGQSRVAGLFESNVCFGWTSSEHTQRTAEWLSRSFFKRKRPSNSRCTLGRLLGMYQRVHALSRYFLQEFIKRSRQTSCSEGCRSRCRSARTHCTTLRLLCDTLQQKLAPIASQSKKRKLLRVSASSSARVRLALASRERHETHCRLSGPTSSESVQYASCARHVAP